MRFAKIAGVFLLTAILTSCAGSYLGTVKPNVAAGNEIVFTTELKTLLQDIPKPKIVIRVPNPSANVTEAEKFNAYINVIEKVFVQNGYTVRDRALLENLLRAGHTDYKGIKDKIDTDLIIDILALQFDIPHKVGKFLNKKTQKEESFATELNYVDCVMANLECRLTIVDRGQLGGLFTLRTSRCDNEDLEFYVDGFRQNMAWVGQEAAGMFPDLSVPIEGDELKRAYTQVLTVQLIKLLSSQLQERFQKAVDDYNAHRYGEASEILSALIEKDPGNFNYYIFSGMIAARQKDFAKGQQELNKALGNASPAARASAYYAYANLYSLKNEKETSLSYLKKAFEAGFTDFKHVREDEDLANIQNLPEFSELLKIYQSKTQSPVKKTG